MLNTQNRLEMTLFLCIFEVGITGGTRGQQDDKKISAYPHHCEQAPFFFKTTKNNKYVGRAGLEPARASLPIRF